MHSFIARQWRGCRRAAFPPLLPAPEGPHSRSPVGASVAPAGLLAALRGPAVTPDASALPGRSPLCARPLGSAHARRRCGLSRPRARGCVRDDAPARAARARRLRRLRAATGTTPWAAGWPSASYPSGHRFPLISPAC